MNAIETCPTQTAGLVVVEVVFFALPVFLCIVYETQASPPVFVSGTAGGCYVTVTQTNESFLRTTSVCRSHPSGPKEIQPKQTIPSLSLSDLNMQTLTHSTHQKQNRF